MFCVCQGNEALGIGKVSIDASGSISVNYFISPTDKLLTVHPSKIKKKELCQQTRVYYRDIDTGLWTVGRFLSSNESHVRVGFPNRKIMELPIEDVFVRCDIPIDDPVSYLSKFLNETPLFANSRRKFVKNMLDQRRVSRGMSGLISSVVELENHQFRVVERILNDPIQRYLLADEVGLGKTIEAGIVIRQYVLDCPDDHNIVIVVPPNLVQQWTKELSARFLLDLCIDTSIHIIANDDKKSLSEILPEAKMLVVDEAHQVYQGEGLSSLNDEYKLICASAHHAERVLLLSATPALGNEEGFLAMLHLLDPIVYPLSGLEEFRKKIENRQPLAHIIAELSPDNLFFLEESLSQLNELFPGDKNLKERTDRLLGSLEDVPSEADEEIVDAIKSIRTYVSETYKLHRRILRNRRRDVSVLTPQRIGFKKEEYQSPDRALVVDLLEQWRNQATLSTHADGESFSSLFFLLIDALFSSPLVLKNLLENRISRQSRGSDYGARNLLSLPLFANENEILKRVLFAVEGLSVDQSKLYVLHNLLLKLIESEKKVVVFCDQSYVADRVFDFVDSKIPGRSLRHDHRGIEDACSIDADSCSILICDRSAEEGLNLHGGKKVMVHFDLPISPNRIEQRIGRIDRYGSGADVFSYGLVCTNDLFEVKWCDCLENGFGVFQHSIATLQYLVDEELKLLKVSLFEQGVESLGEAMERLGGPSGVLSREMTKIEIQDQLDAIHEEDSDVFDSLEDYDCQWKKISRQIDSWVERCLLFKKTNYHVSKPFPPDRVFRWQYNYETNRDTLLPLDRFMENFISSIDFEDPRSQSRSPRSYPFSYRRDTSISKKVNLLRYGNPFIDGVIDFTTQDDRGKSFAVWRCAPDYSSQEGMDHFFRFDFIVEVDLEPLRKSSESVTSVSTDSILQAFSRQGDSAFPPLYLSVWLDAELETPSEQIISDYLEVGYQKSPRENNGSYDRNININRWEWLWKYFTMFRNWEDICIKAKLSAFDAVRVQTNLEEYVQESLGCLERKNETYYSQMKSRIKSLSEGERRGEEIELENQMIYRSALLSGISSPKLKIDSVGVVFLSDFMPSFE